MKKRLLIGKTIGFIGIIIFAMGISYIVTFFSERKKYQDVNLAVTFEDTTSFLIDQVQVRENALKTYPYKFIIKNESDMEVTYQIKITDIKLEEIKRNDLNYILYKKEEILKEDSFKNLKNNCLAQDGIKSKQENNYSLYIYTDEETKGFYEYKLEISTSK